MPGRIQVKIQVFARRPSLSTVNVVPLDKEQPVKRSHWRNKVYLWPQKASDAVIVAKDDHYIVVTEEGRLIVVYGYAADSRKYGEYYAAVLRAKAGAKAEGERVGAENAELLAEAVGGKIEDVVAEMATEGYAAASSQSTKRAANVAAYLAMKKLAEAEAEEKDEKPEERSEEQQTGKPVTPAEAEKPAEERKEQEEEQSEAEEDELLKEIEEARRRLAQLGAEEQQKPVTPAGEREAEKPAEAEERREEREGQQPEEAEEERPSPFSKYDDYVVFVDGQPYLRLWLVKAGKPSEYLGSRQETRVNGQGELEIVKKLKPWASKLETIRRKLNQLLAESEFVWRGDGYFGYNTSLRIVLHPLGFRELAKAYALARHWAEVELRKVGAPREVIDYVLAELKPRPVPMLVPFEAGVAILRAIEAWYQFRELPRVKEALRKHQEQRNKKMARKLEAELQALEKQLQRLREALAELEKRLEKRYAQST